MSTSGNNITLIGGIDVGNGYVKGVIQNTQQSTFDEIDLPSAVVSTSRTSPKVPLPDADAASVLAGDFYNQIDCSLTTPLVAASDRRIFGRAALSVRGSKFTEFEVLGKHSKADQELSKVLVLGVFAAKALRDYVRENSTLPDHELRVQVRAGLALPISEFVARRHAYAAEFVGLPGSADPTVHLVTIKNFSTPVSVRLQFVDVQVMAEGASAQFAITDKGEPLAQALLDDLRARDATVVEGVSASDLVAVQNTIGVDVGEGTVNFPVFTDGRFNPEAADTLDEGYGTALMNAMERMRESDATLQFSSRKQLADFLHAEPSVLVKNRHQRTAGFVEAEASYLVDEIVSSFSDVLSQAGATTEVVYVYGGGSGPIKHMLHPALLKTAGDVPVLYLDSSYSRHLNREGLYIAARHVEQEALAAKSAGKRSKGVA
ncbi:ParM/StbA family protein [Streptomyces chrestomyceticus]|uniref:ParM/StbA family protein n=1 Tax=Streptomyces chrestomyceticus TaxID=68185 RepID=UPI0033CC72F7